MTDKVRVAVTIDSNLLAELEFTDLGQGDWSARVAVQTPEGLQMYQRGIPAYPDDLNVLGLMLSVLSRLPEEAFHGTATRSSAQPEEAALTIDFESSSPRCLGRTR